VPAGIVAATLPPHHDLAMNREGQGPLSPALAASLGGDIDRWRIGDLVVSPPTSWT
jgi:hypothetical protein